MWFFEFKEGVLLLCALGMSLFLVSSESVLTSSCNVTDERAQNQRIEKLQFEYYKDLFMREF
mgnify:CR=1 FL=1